MNAYIWVPASPTTICYHRLNKTLMRASFELDVTFVCSDVAVMYPHLLELYPYANIIGVEQNFSMLRFQRVQQWLFEERRIANDGIVIRLCPDAVILDQKKMLDMFYKACVNGNTHAGRRSETTADAQGHDEHVEYVSGPCNVTSAALLRKMDLTPLTSLLFQTGTHGPFDKLVEVAALPHEQYVRGSSDYWYTQRALNAGGTVKYLEGLLELTEKPTGDTPVWHPARKQRGRLISDDARLEQVRNATHA